MRIIKKTGLSGFTLISNSRGLRLLAHQKIADVRTALRENQDIESVSETIELQAFRSTVGDTDEGAALREEIADLYRLLTAYQKGEFPGQRFAEHSEADAFSAAETRRAEPTAAAD